MTHSIAKTEAASAPLVLTLPEIAFTRSGIRFQPNEDIWHWVDGPFGLHIDYRKIKSLSPSICESLKHTLMVFAKRGSSSYVVTLFTVFKNYLSLRDEAQPLTSITAAEVSNYAARLTADEKHRICVLNVLLQKWAALNLSGVEPNCALYLRELRRPKNKTGDAVRTRDPVRGPYSESEYKALYKAVDTAYGAGQIPQWVAVLNRLLFACGGRISQYSSLKVKDLDTSKVPFVLSLPQVKRRNVNSRKDFVDFDLSPQTGRLLMQYIESLKTKDCGDDTPLFPETVVMTRSRVERRRNEGDLFFGHCLAENLGQIFCKTVNPIAPLTERLNFAPIPVTTRRFRSTFGTRLAEEGASKTVIADRLGHGDLRYVDVYVENSPKNVENRDKAMDHGLVPLSQAFTGRVIEGEENSTHRGAPGSRIIDFRVAKEPVGSCACKGQGCAFIRPTTCYTCFKFEPWLDAPHEKVLRRLQEERKLWDSDERMATINDDAIRAVQEVIAECATVQEQRRQGANT